MRSPSRRGRLLRASSCLRTMASQTTSTLCTTVSSSRATPTTACTCWWTLCKAKPLLPKRYHLPRALPRSWDILSPRLFVFLLYCFTASRYSGHKVHIFTHVHTHLHIHIYLFYCFTAHAKITEATAVIYPYSIRELQIALPLLSVDTLLAAFGDCIVSCGSYVDSLIAVRGSPAQGT